MTDLRCDLLCLDLDTAERLRSARPAAEELAEPSARAAALADPTRLAIALALAEVDELCVCDLSWIVERSDNLVSHHVRRLRTAGLVSSTRRGKMVMYALTEPGRRLLAAVAGTRVDGGVAA